MNTGDTYILGKVGIGYDPETSGNSYKLYVNGSSYFNGGTTHGGIIYANAGVRIQNSTTYPQIELRSNDDTKSCSILLYANMPATNNIHRTDRFIIREHTYNSSTGAVDTSKYEDYRLPSVNADRTTTASYDILTTKNTVTTAQGGTGNTSYTASRIIYSNTATKLASGSIVTDGGYLGSVSYLSINTAHQTSYRLRCNGSAYFDGAVSVPSTLTVRAENTTTEGGQICLTADPNHSAYHAYLDVCANYFRVHSNGEERFSVNLSSYGTSKFTGLLQITKNSNTVTIGSANTNWCHFENSANIPFYFNKAVHVNGDVYYYNTKVHMSSSGFHPPKNGGIYWDPYVESASDASDVTQIVQIASGVAGGTELRIQQANDSTDVINLLSPYYIYLNSKRAFTIYDSWLRINEDKGFSSGVYFGSSLVRTDGTLRAGTGSSSWTDITAGVVVSRIDSGEARLEARNGTHRVYLYCNSDGRSGLYGVRTDGTAFNLIAFANNSSTGTFYGNCTGSSASCTGNAASANYVKLYEARGSTTNLNKAANYVAAGAMFHLVASSSTTTGKTSFDANILQMNWDNNGGYDSQLGISTSGSRMQIRSQASAGTAWREVVTATAATQIGSATQPVYISNTGQATACTTYANASVNYATSAGSATKATQDGSGNTITSTYLKLSGGTMTGALNFANNTWNNVGDDCAMGDCNQSGLIGIKSLNNANRSGFQFYNSSGTALATLAATSSNVITVSTVLYTTGYLQSATHLYLGTSGHVRMLYNNTWYDAVHNHDNGNISINAASGGLYVGYLNTTSINWLNGKATLDGNGVFFPAMVDVRPGTHGWAMKIGANQWGGTGICNGTADNTGNGSGNLSIASWYGIIFEDGTNWTTKAGINCRTGVYYGKGFSNTSSILVKENIKSLSEDKARQILLTRPVSFDYKKEFSGMKGQFGLIAEELEQILPELVEQPTDKKGFKHIDYTRIIPFLIKLAQSQQKEIDELKNKIQFLTN